MKRMIKFVGRITGLSNSENQSPVDDNETVEFRVPIDILDHIFSFLKPHPRDLLACSEAHPVFSRIVERYRFHHIIIKTGSSNFHYSFTPSDLLKHLTETPWIVKYVTVLQIEFDPPASRGIPIEVPLKEIASLIPMFPVLECIILSTKTFFPASWQKNLPQIFRTALEDCLRLPTLQEVHLGNMSFPLSLLDNLTNINYLSLSGPPEYVPEYVEIPYPQIKSLACEGFEHRDSYGFDNWAKFHITQLRSLKYDLSCHRMILRVLDICSDTLENVYLCLHRKGTPLHVDFINLSSLSHLRHLTIHTEVYFTSDDDGITHHTFLPTAFDILKTAPPLQQLTIEIYLDITWGSLDHINISRLGILTELTICFHHVDLYVFTGLPRLPITHTQMRSFLEKHEGLIKLIEQGVLVLHPEETAPTLSRAYTAREMNRECIIM